MKLPKTFFVLLMIPLLLPAPMLAATPDINNAEAVEAFFDGAVKTNMRLNHSPSGVVAVMKDDRIVFAKGYGFADVEERIPVDPATTLFRPGSISKLFTWISVMQQVERGHLDLDTDVNDYLQSFKIKDSWPGQPVTLRHLMTHTAGFEDGVFGYLIIDDPERIMSLAESLEKYQPRRVNPPGAHTAYSNWGAALAGLIVADVSGMAFSDYVQRNIFDVLGMKNASFVEPLPEYLNHNMAISYGYEKGKYFRKNYEIISNFGPAGALAASALDMSLLARALLNGGEYHGRRILQAETIDEMLSYNFSHDPRTRGMALGFLEYPFNGIDIIGHDGGTTIFVSHFGLSRKENLMLFFSFSGPGARSIYPSLEKSFYDEFYPPEMAEITPPENFAERASKYEGTYQSWQSSFTKIEKVLRPLGGVEVSDTPDNLLLVGDRLFVEEQDKLFRAVEADTRIVFQEDENGKITGFISDGLAVEQMEKVPAYQSIRFLVAFIALSTIVFFGVLMRRSYQRREYTSLPVADKRAFRAAVLVAVLNLAFLIMAAVSVVSAGESLIYEVPDMIKVTLILPILVALAALYQLYQFIQVWRGGLLGGIFSRLRYSMVTICSLFMVWFYYNWNVLGFNYYS